MMIKILRDTIGGLPISNFRQKNRAATPREKFGVVFDVVQLSRALLDSKTFVDCIPKAGPSTIQKTYRAKHGAALSIREFVTENFNLPDPAMAPPSEAEGEAPVKEVREYIDHMWDVLTRHMPAPHPDSSLIPLPYRYVVPGGRFREIYYWDSYYTMIGLKEAGRKDLVLAMTDNFAHLIRKYGYIPNGNRTYYLTRSQPPVFALMVSLLAEMEGPAVYPRYVAEMEKEYQYWMRGATKVEFREKRTDAAEHVVRMPGGELLNRYYDSGAGPREESFAEDVETARAAEDSSNFYKNIRAGAESGWDFTSRWFKDQQSRKTIYTTELIPPDLNSFLYLTESAIARAYEEADNIEQAAKYRDLATARADAVRKYLWNEEMGWYCDYVYTEGLFSPSLSLAGMFPLFAGIASSEEAAACARTLESRFMRPGGLVTTYVNTGEQWDAPNGWAPLQYAAILGLERYGFGALAEDIARRWCTAVIDVFERTGTLLEKYNVEDTKALAAGGEYALQDGFGWTNGVLLALMNRYRINVPAPPVEEVLE